MGMGKLVVVVVVALILVGGTSGQADTRYVSALCNHNSIPQGSAFWGHLGSLLAELVDNTPYSDGYNFKARTGGGNSPAFGLGSCSTSIPPRDCQNCLQTLSTDIWRICNSALGARVLYEDCYIRYESYYF